MPIDLNEVLKNPATLSVLGAIGAFVLSTFLAPRLGEIIKSFAAFIFLNIKHFISFALLTIIFHFILKIPVLINIPLTVTIITLISLSIEFKSFSKNGYISDTVVTTQHAPEYKKYPLNYFFINKKPDTLYMKKIYL